MASEMGAFSADIRYQKSVVVPHMYADRFGGAESGTEASLHTYGAPLPTYNACLTSILNDRKALYACSDAQCQIRRRRIRSTTDSAAPNLTLSITGCIQGRTTIQYQLLTYIISQ